MRKGKERKRKTQSDAERTVTDDSLERISPFHCSEVQVSWSLKQIVFIRAGQFEEALFSLLLFRFVLFPLSCFYIYVTALISVSWVLTFCCFFYLLSRAAPHWWKYTVMISRVISVTDTPSFWAPAPFLMSKCLFYIFKKNTDVKIWLEFVYKNLTDTYLKSFLTCLAFERNT